MTNGQIFDEAEAVDVEDDEDAICSRISHLREGMARPTLAASPSALRGSRRLRGLVDDYALQARPLLWADDAEDGDDEDNDEEEEGAGDEEDDETDDTEEEDAEEEGVDAQVPDLLWRHSTGPRGGPPPLSSPFSPSARVSLPRSSASAASSSPHDFQQQVSFSFMCRPYLPIH